MWQRLNLSAWAGSRKFLLAMREQRLFQPAADRAIRWARPEGRSVMASLSDERRFEQAFNRLLQTAKPIESVPGRVVMICGSLQPGGAERQLAYAVRGLAQVGIRDVTVLCAHLVSGQPERYDFFRPEVCGTGATVRQIRRLLPLLAPMPHALLEAAPFLPAGLVCDVADLWRELVLLRPAVVHGWLDWSNVRAGIAAALAGVPRIVLAGRNINPSRSVFPVPMRRQAVGVL